MTLRRNVTRDLQIADARRRGVRASVVARAYGISVARVRQIVEIQKYYGGLRVGKEANPDWPWRYGYGPSAK